MVTFAHIKPSASGGHCPRSPHPLLGLSPLAFTRGSSWTQLGASPQALCTQSQKQKSAPMLKGHLSQWRILGWTLRPGPFGMRKIVGVFIRPTHKQKTCSLTSRIFGYFFVNMYLKLLLPEAFFSSKCNKYCLAARLCPDPLGELTSLPRHHILIKGSLLLREGAWEGSGWNGRGRDR